MWSGTEYKSFNISNSEQINSNSIRGWATGGKQHDDEDETRMSKNVLKTNILRSRYT